MKSPRKAGSFQKGDERILGDGKFVDKVFSRARETFERKYSLKAKGVDIERIAERVAEITGMSTDEIWSFGKQSRTVFARSLLCYWATGELGIKRTYLSRKLGISQAAVSLSVSRGHRIVTELGHEIGNL